MKRWLVTSLLLAISGAELSCSRTPATPPDTRAADAQAIRDYEAQWTKEFAAKDMDKIVAHYAPDGAVLMPALAIMNGPDAIRAGLKTAIDDPNFSLQLQTAKVEVSNGGDIAYSQGAYAVTTTDAKTKKPVTEKGKYVEVYRKQADGSWKIVEDINNADPPEPPPPAK